MNITWENDTPQVVIDALDRLAEAEYVVRLNGVDVMIVGLVDNGHGLVLEHYDWVDGKHDPMTLATTPLQDVEYLRIY